MLARALPATADVRSRDTLTTSLSTLDGLVVLTRTSDVLAVDANPEVKPGYLQAQAPDPLDYDVVLDSDGLKSKALNNPFVAKIDLADSPDLFVRATVTMPDTGDDYALPEVALLANVADDGSFVGVVVPKAASWPATAKAKPRVVSSHIRPIDPATNTGGFNFESRLQGLWTSNNYAAGDADLKWLQALTEAPSHYGTEPGYTHTAGATMDYALVRHGRRLRLCSRLHDFAPATCSSNAAYTTQVGYLYTDDARMSASGRVRAGIAVNTDTWASKAAFAHAAYADQEVTLTSAAQHKDIAHYTTSGMPSGVSYFYMPSPSNTRLDAHAADGSFAAVDLRDFFYVGQHIMTSGGGAPHSLVISSFTTTAGVYNGIICDVTTGENGVHQLVWLRGGDTWAESSSATQTQAIQGSTTLLWVDPKTIKTTQAMIGYGLFTGNDPTALLYDAGWIQSDGTTHYRLDTAFAGGASNWPGGAGTSPSVWKLLFHHNALGLWQASVACGLPVAGRMVIERERVRYAEYAYTKWHENLANPGYANAGAITAIPTYYVVPAAQAAPSTTVQNYNAALGDYDTIPDAAGLLFETTARSSGGAVSSVPNVYVTGNGVSGGVGYATLDTLPAGPILDTDITIVSGRGQLGSKKVTHPSDAPICYDPLPLTATAAYTSLVTVSRLEAYSGRYVSLQDALQKLCALAGVRGVSFRTLATLAHATLSTTPVAMIDAASADVALSDFLLDLSVHLDATAHLLIDFRSKAGASAYYRLHIWQPLAGYVQCGLETLSTDVDASGGPLAGSNAESIRESGDAGRGGDCKRERARRGRGE